MHRAASMLALTAACLLSARPTAAQALSARATVAPAQLPAANTLVAMVSDSATIVAVARTDSAGVFSMQPGRPGSFRLLFFRSGVGTVLTPPIRLDFATYLEREFVLPGDSAASGTVYFAGDVDKPAAPAGGAAPKYPNAYVARGIRGLVRALFVVDESGRIDPASAQIIGSTDGAFSSAVRQTFKGLRFVPAEHGGRKVPQLFQYTFDFGCAGDPVVGDVIIRAYSPACGSNPP